MYFTNDPNGDGFMFHENEEDARDIALEALGNERDEAEEGWDDAVDEICWGKVIGRVVEKVDDHDYQDYELKEI